MSPKPKPKPSAKSLANLKPFKKGEVANPLGGKTHNKDLRALRHLTTGELVEVGSFVLEQDIPSLKALVKAGEKADSKISALKMWMANVALKGFQKGDVQSLDVFLNRTVGKVKDTLQVNTQASRPQVVIMLPAKDPKPVEVLPDITVEPKKDADANGGS